MMKVLLSTWGHEATLATTAAGAFCLVQSQRFDLCLLDTNLPDESGVELCKRICGLDDPSPVVFISGHGREVDKMRGLNAGALAYLTKPVDFDELENTLAWLLDRASGNSSEGVQAE